MERMTAMAEEVVQWADPAQFWAQPIERNESGVIRPKVYLLWMTPDPLGALAAMNKMYAGEVVRSLTEVTDDERRHHWNEVTSTQLKAPLETIVMHFLIEGVDLSFTHQLVRQRTAAYAQESLRFAVKGEPDFLLPPSIVELPEDDERRLVYEDSCAHSHSEYLFLVQNGIPSEDARSLMPRSTATRIHYVTNLRNLSEHAGNRLCTQAQFIWRYVFAGIVDSIRKYGRYLDDPEFYPPEAPNEWQFELIADSMLFRPVCYQIGKCPWKAQLDRPCSIRQRVDALAIHGINPEYWGDETDMHSMYVINPIRPEEWLLNPDAAR
jgi:flavin-dependent thymidylate synthase